MRRKGWIIWAGVMALAAAAGAAPVIERVEHRVFETARASRDLLPSRLSSFDAAPAGAMTEKFFVDWRTGEGRLPAGVLVTFEFQMERSPRIRTLFIQYPFEVQGRRRATFEVAESVTRQGGRVEAWRVRVVHQGRRLAEKTSESWREAPR